MVAVVIARPVRMCVGDVSRVDIGVLGGLNIGTTGITGIGTMIMNVGDG
jgi:hypothetical protein